MRGRAGRGRGDGARLNTLQPLRDCNSFGVAAQAAEILRLEQPDDLHGLVFSPRQDLVLGGGSNVLLAGDIPGRVLLVRLAGRRVLRQDSRQVLVEAGAGEHWHELVRWSLAQGLSGLENLSLIPGLCGAAPMQNIGAYGVELSDRLESLTAWDWRQGRLREFGHAQCRFAYRDSYFKSAAPDRYLITAIRLRLDVDFQPVLNYAGVQQELDAAGISTPGATDVSDAVMRIRRRKLPDPSQLGNAGSFFKNPVLPAAQAATLARRFPGLPLYPQADGRVKAGAAWMIEHCGWKGRRMGDAGVSAQHALVLVNHGSASGADLLDLAGQIIASVAERFALQLECEPRIVRLPAPPIELTRLLVGDPVRNMAGGDMLAGRIAVAFLVVKEDVGAKCRQEPALGLAPQKQCLVDADAPVAQGEDDALVGRRGACSDQRGADRVALDRVRRLDIVDGLQHAFEWPAVERGGGGLALTAGKRIQTLFLVDPLRLVAEQHGIAVKGNAQLLLRPPAGRAGQYHGGGKARFQNPSHIFCMGGQEQVSTQGLHVTIRWLPVGKHGPRDIQAKMLDGVENAQAGVGAVT